MAATKVFSDFAIAPSVFPEVPRPRIMRGFGPQTSPRKSEKLLERACIIQIFMQKQNTHGHT